MVRVSNRSPLFLLLFEINNGSAPCPGFNLPNTIPRVCKYSVMGAWALLVKITNWSLSSRPLPCTFKMICPPLVSMSPTFALTTSIVRNPVRKHKLIIAKSLALLTWFNRSVLSLALNGCFLNCCARFGVFTPLATFG